MKNLIIYAFILILGIGMNACALNGQKHTQDVEAVLGVSSKSRYASLAENVSTQMDSNFSELHREINAPMVAAKQFTFHTYTHRLFFHWGFNQSPKGNSALSEQVRRAVEGQNTLVLNEQRVGADISRIAINEDDIWPLISKEWEKRRKLLLDQATGLVGNAAKGEALVLIIYNVHLLGDYSTDAVGALADVRVIAKELIDAIQYFGKKSPAAAKELIKNIERISSKAYSTASQRKCAEEILTLLKKELPAVLQKQL